MTAGLLLTGGASERMGIAKAELLLGGERLADRGARVLTAVCAPVVELGPGYSSLPAVVEDPPGEGPLAALVTGARELTESGRAGPVIVLAVDFPFVDAPLLRLLDDHRPAAITAPVAEGKAQSCCARYAPEALALAAQLYAEGERSLRALFARSPVDLIAEAHWRAVAPAHALDDIDTPDDLARHGLARPG